MLGSRPIKPILPLNHPERDQPPAPAPQPQYPPQQPVYAEEPEVPEFELPPLPQPRPERRPLQPQMSPQDDYHRASPQVPPSHAPYAGYQEPAPQVQQPQPHYEPRQSRQPQYQPQTQPEPAPTYEYPSEPVEPRPYREPRQKAPRSSGRHSVFSTQFMRVMVLLSVLMFGMLIGMKFSDYFHRRDFTALQEEQALLNGTGKRTLPPVVPLTPLPPDPSLLADNSNLPPIPPTPDSAPVPAPAPAPAVAPLQPGFNPPAGSNSNLSSELDAQRMEREMLNRRYQNLTNGGGSGTDNGVGAGGYSPIPPASGIPALPPAASNYSPASSSIPTPPDANSVPLPPAAGDYPPLPTLSPGFNPSSAPKAPANLDAAAKRVKDAQPIAKVKSFEADWGVVILNAGKANNLNVGHGLAIRRGHTVLGEIVLEEVYDSESTAELSGAWKVDPKAPKPQAGDDVISWPLF